MTTAKSSGASDESHRALGIAELYDTTRRRLFPNGLWGLFYARRTAGEFQFGGFAIPPFGLDIEHRFAVNGVDAQCADASPDATVDQLAERFGLAPPYAR